MSAFRCFNCDEPVAVEEHLADFAVRHGVLCPRCQLQKVSALEHVRRGDGFAEYFAALCPPLFVDTVKEKLPCPSRSDHALKALTWDTKYGVRVQYGLNLWGHTATGKTRTVSLIVEREVHAGRGVIALGPGGFREGCEARNYRRTPWLKILSNVDLLVIDDLDKMNLTREMEKDFFAVMNNRMGRKPTITTGNTSGNELKLQFKHGEALVRRIRDFCTSIHFGREDIGR